MLRYILICLLLSFGAHAHEPFEIIANANLLPDRITLNLLITDSTAAKLCLPEGSPSSKLHEAELTSDREQIERCASELFLVKDGTETIAPREVKLSLSEEKDLEVALTYPPAKTNNLSFDAIHLVKLEDPTYGNTFTAIAGDRFIVQQFLQAENRSVEIMLDTKSPSAQAGFAEFLHLGIEHILMGFDHLLFLAALLIACRRVRSALVIVTTFTLAHSITLGLASLKIVSLPGDIVEPLIAATIVFVALENFWLQRKDQEPRGRWLLTFSFGLIHGFGFAGALQTILAPVAETNILMPLLAFNMGIELGQVAIASLFLPLFFWFRRYPAFVRWAAPTISLSVATAGLYWLVERTLL
jgi:hydrogenase/urease accessory protein HupE